jgi:hypothetical protein
VAVGRAAKANLLAHLRAQQGRATATEALALLQRLKTYACLVAECRPHARLRTAYTRCLPRPILKRPKP